MKILFSVLLTLALTVVVLAQSQDTSGQSSSGQSSTSSQGSQGQAGQSQGSQGQAGQGQSGQTMTGKVSKDRKSFTSDKDSKTYAVSNPDALQGQEGQHVSVLVAVDPDTNTIHIVQLEAPPQ